LRAHPFLELHDLDARFSPALAVCRPECALLRPDRIVPLIVAVALFMENLDSTVIATSLPAIAPDINTNPHAH